MDADKHSTVDRTAPHTKESSISNVRSAEFEKADLDGLGVRLHIRITRAGGGELLKAPGFLKPTTDQFN